MDQVVRASFLLGAASGAFAVIFQGLRNLGQTERLVSSLGFQLHVSPGDFLILGMTLFLMCLAADTYHRYTGKGARP